MVLLGVLAWPGGELRAQDRPESAQFDPLDSGLWLNTYGRWAIGNDFWWIAQFHFRTVASDQVPIVGSMGQIYNRHGISYRFSSAFNATAGAVLRLDFRRGGAGEGEVPLVLEPRLWHEYMFQTPLDTKLGLFMFHHRARIEHRWSRGFEQGDTFIFRNRWRYMFDLRVPLNTYTFSPGTYYLNPNVEVILQNGREVVDSPLEDLRLVLLFGRIISPELTVSGGLMYTMGQKLDDGSQYRQRIMLRIHIYSTLDLF